MLRPETRGRARALQVLYSMEMTSGLSAADAITRLARLTGPDPTVYDLTESLVNAVVSERDELDRMAADYKLSLPFVFAAQGENEGVTYMIILHNLNKSFTSATDPGSQEQVTMGATRYVLALAEDVYSKRTPNYERALSLAGLTEIQL